MSRPLPLMLPVIENCHQLVSKSRQVGDQIIDVVGCKKVFEWRHFPLAVPDKSTYLRSRLLLLGESHLTIQTRSKHYLALICRMTLHASIGKNLLAFVG